MTTLHQMTKEHGPSLIVDFHIKKGQISQIDLRLNEDPFLQWCILSEEPAHDLFTKIISWMKAYASRKQPKIVLPLQLREMPSFSKIVLENLQAIPLGSVISYQELARKALSPKASRAVGNICGKNHLPLVIPCHRVIASSQHIGGFSLNPEIKKRLLKFEMQRDF